MSLLGNIIWLLFGGLISGLGYIIGGLTLCLTIVGIPFGLQQIKVGLATMTPFGKQVITVENADSPLRVILNIVWVLCFGWAIALSHLIHGVILAITIIGLPFAKQHFKLLVMAVLPFGRELVDIDR
ncbi:MAG: YccF domain-containing protein [Oscillatoriales cyanobacterium]|nr:MAG: YccF domain-containing protein [Oscillatoriales cyanobacterium]